MKKLIQMLTLGVMAVVLAVPAFARLNSEHAAAVVQDDDAKNALYTKVTENINKNNQVAYEAAKEYLTKWPTDDDAIAKYLKDFVVKYEKALRKDSFGKAMAAQKWAEAFPLGKSVIQDEPGELQGYYNTSWSGLQLAASGNNTNNAEATNFSKKTIEMIEAGKTPETGKPYPDATKQKDLGWLNYSLYVYSLKNNQSDTAAEYLIKAAQYENPIKSDPTTYLKLAKIYGDEYDKRSADYKSKFDGQPKSPEGDAAYERVKQEADLLIDAIARAIAYSGTDPKTQVDRDELKKTLTDYYKFRHGSVDGVDALIAGIKAKPLPKPADVVAPTAPASTSTPAPTSTTTAAGAKTAPTSATPATSTTTTGTPTKPNNAHSGAAGANTKTVTASSNSRRSRRR